MSTLKRTSIFSILAVAMGLASIAEYHAAAAQAVNRVGALAITDSAGAGQVNTEGQKASYSAVATGLAPAASATDVACIAGSATKTIKLTQITVSGTAGTLVTLPVFLAKRATADTGGTPATGNALPVGSKLDSNNAAASATLVAYTANPTINDSSPLLIGAGTVTLPVTSAGTTNSRLVFQWGSRPAQAPTLRGAAQQICVNLSGISVSSGLLNIDFEFTEE